MAFNVQDYVKTADQSPTTVITTAVASVASGLPTNMVGVAQTASQSLIEAGAAFDSIAQFAASRVDTLQSNVQVVTALTDDTFRFTGADIAKTRRGESLGLYLNEINPTTKINASKSKAAIFIADALF